MRVPATDSRPDVRERLRQGQSSQACSLSRRSRVQMAQNSGLNQNTVRTTSAPSCTIQSPRLMCASSWRSTTSRRAVLQSRACEGSSTRGRHRPHVASKSGASMNESVTGRLSWYSAEIASTRSVQSVLRTHSAPASMRRRRRMPTSSIKPNTATPEVHTTPPMTAPLAPRALPLGSNVVAGVIGALRPGDISRRDSGSRGTST